MADGPEEEGADEDGEEQHQRPEAAAALASRLTDREAKGGCRKQRQHQRPPAQAHHVQVAFVEGLAVLGHRVVLAFEVVDPPVVQMEVPRAPLLHVVAPLQQLALQTHADDVVISRRAAGAEWPRRRAHLQLRPLQPERARLRVVCARGTVFGILVGAQLGKGDAWGRWVDVVGTACGPHP